MSIDIRADIAPDADPAGDPADYSWIDVGSYRRQSTDITFGWGRDDESDESDIEPAESNITFDMRDGYLSPRNPYSDLYGRIGQNTPIRYRLKVFSDDFDRTVASGWGTSTSGHTWSAGGSYSVSGGVGHMQLASPHTASPARVTDAGALDVDVVYSIAINAVTTGGPWISAVELRRLDSANMYRVHTELKPAGEIYLKVTKIINGVASDTGTDGSAADTYAAGGKVWTRVQAFGGSIRARSWTGVLDDEPSSWDATTDDATGIEGTGFGFYQWRYIDNTNVGTLSVEIDDMSVHALLWSGSVPEWNPRWDKSGEDATTAIVAAGPVRRLIQGNDPIRSPLTRQLPRYNPGGHWPLEDGSDATSAASSLPSGRAAIVIDVTFGESDCPPGAESAMRMNSADSSVRGYTTEDTGAEWSGMIFVKLAALPAGYTTLVEWRSTSGTLRRWLLQAGAIGYRLLVYDSSDTLVVTAAPVTYGVDQPTEWTAIQLETVQNGGNVDWAFIWHRVGADVFWVFNDSVAGTTTRIREFSIPAQTGLVDALYSHIFAGPETLPFVDAGFLEVSTGYAGELAAARIARLCAEQNVRVAILPGDSEPMGAQRPGEFLELLSECASTDMGLLYERAYSLGYVPRGARYNPPVALELDWAAGDFHEAPEPTDDDQRLRNRWTVKRRGGSEATYEDAQSIARHGPIGDLAEINNNSDDRLILHAQWRTMMSTIDEMRWPVIVIDLIANPDLIPYFLGLYPGSRIVVVNPKSQIPGITIDLVVEGARVTIGRHTFLVEMACSPARPWLVGTYSDDSVAVTSDMRRYGSESTILDVDVDETEMSWDIEMSSPNDTWSTTHVPYKWSIGGEDVTVTAMSGVTINSITSYSQTATVQRSVNGIVKLHAAGASIRLHSDQQARYAL